MTNVVDADAHVYEPEALWEQFVPAADRSLARQGFWHALGPSGELSVLNGAACANLNRSRIIRQAIWRPGMSLDDIGALDPDVMHELNEGASDPIARLADMDAMGIDQAVLYPTLFLEYVPLVKNPLAADVLCRAYNDWIHDYCQADARRLHPVAILPLQSMVLAQRELDRVAELGFRTVALRPMFYEVENERTGHSEQARAWRFAREMAQSDNMLMGSIVRRGPYLIDWHFQPLWQQLTDLGMTASLHPSSGTASPELASTGPFAERVAQNLHIGHPIAESVAYRMDMGLAIVAACFSGLLEDYPQLKIAFPHAGASFVPLAIEKAEVYLWRTAHLAIQPVQPVSLEPLEVFERHPLTFTFSSWEESVLALTDDLYADKCTWGSRYPHHDACTPDEAFAGFAKHGASEPVVDAMMGGNAAQMFGLDAEPVGASASQAATAPST